MKEVVVVVVPRVKRKDFFGGDGVSNSRSVVQGQVSSFEPTVIKWYSSDSKSKSSEDQSGYRGRYINCI